MLDLFWNLFLTFEKPYFDPGKSTLKMHPIFVLKSIMMKSFAQVNFKEKGPRKPTSREYTIITTSAKKPFVSLTSFPRLKNLEFMV